MSKHNPAPLNPADLRRLADALEEKDAAISEVAALSTQIKAAQTRLTVAQAEVARLGGMLPTGGQSARTRNQRYEEEAHSMGLITQGEAAAILGISSSAVWKASQNGRLAVAEEGKAPRPAYYREADVRAYGSSRTNDWRKLRASQMPSVSVAVAPLKQELKPEPTPAPVAVIAPPAAIPSGERIDSGKAAEMLCMERVAFLRACRDGEFPLIAAPLMGTWDAESVRETARRLGMKVKA